MISEDSCVFDPLSGSGGLSSVHLFALAALKAGFLSSHMAVDKDGEPLELCEECGSPLEDGFCHSCGAGFSEGASPVGAAPLDRRELSKVLRRNVGPRAHGSYALSMQQEEGMAPLRKEIQSLVEQFSASPEAKSSVRENAERTAVKLIAALGPTKAAIASVAQEFLSRGRNAVEVSSCISNVHSWVGQFSDLVIEVYPTASSGSLAVTIDNRERAFKSSSEGLYRRLRIPLYAGDGNATVCLKGAILTRDGYDKRRVRPLSPSSFVLALGERNFELFKLLKVARLSGELANGDPDPKTLLRKYSIAKLPLTEELLRAANQLPRVNAEYSARFAEKLKDGRGRSPRKLAEEALIEACSAAVPDYLSVLLVERYHLKPSRVKSLVVMPELAEWQG
jgi:hypothetical protein